MFGSSKPFGTASAFGASSFGNTTTPFGQSTNTFGAKPATNNVFGASTFGATPTAPIGGSLFGSSTPASGTGLFGQPSTAFGAPAASTTGGFGFGTTSSAGGGLFGSTPATQSSSGLFGNTASSAFGSPRPTFGGFNSTTSGTGLFGQSTTTGTGLFGSTGGFASATQSGTTVKFNPPTGTDTMMKGGASTSIGTRHQCITCMKEYENKSLEELRLEDYAANRKGGTATTMGFGTPTQQTGLFGAPAASTSAFSFGNTTQAKPLFGSTATTNTFGTSSLFGQPAQNQSTGLFGKTVGFGAPATSAAPAFNFGASTGTSLFGQNNQAKPLFGQTTGGTGLFGSTATTQSTGFGNTTGFGAFGSTQPSTGLFGAKPTGFGTTSTTTTNTFSFGNTNTMNSGGLFGQKPAAPAFGTTNAFGTPSTGFGAFGTTPAAGTGLFGQAKPATSTFGTGGNLFGGGNLGTGFGASTFGAGTGFGTSTGTGLFGAANTNKAPGFNFGNTGSTGFSFGAANPSNSGFSFGTTVTPTDPNATTAFQQAQQQILAMTINPFGDSPLFRNPIKDTNKEAEVLKPTNPAAQKAMLKDNHYKVTMLPTAKIKPKPWSPAPTGKSLLFDGLEDEEPSLGNAAFVPKTSVKKLVLKNISQSNRSSFTLTSNMSPSQTSRIDVSISLKSPQHSTDKPGDKSSTTPLTIGISERNSTSAIPTRQTPDSIHRELLESSTSNIRNNLNNSMNDSIAALHTNRQVSPGRTYNVWSRSPESLEIHDHSSGDKAAITVVDRTLPQTDSDHPTGIILTDPSYYTRPTLDEMIPLLDNDKCPVKDFTVGRIGYGEVVFPGVTDVYGLNLDEIVHFGKKEINVYPDDEKKPDVGKGLNRRATVILENIWPSDKTTHEPIKDPERIIKMGYKEKIERCTAQLGATFVDYKINTGSWIFEVDHFSKYGLEDSDEEMDVPKVPEKMPAETIPKKLVEQGDGKVTTDNFLFNTQPKRRPLGTFNPQDQEMETLASQILSYPLTFDDEELMNEVAASESRPILSSDIDVERIQGMKASFFQEEMDLEDWGSTAYSPRMDTFYAHRQDAMENFLGSPAFDKSSNNVSKKQKYFDKGEEQSYISVHTPTKYNEAAIAPSLSSLSISTTKLPEWLAAFPIVKSSSEKEIEPKPLPLAVNKVYLKSLKTSVMSNKQHLWCDAGYFMGRSFRVGWTSDGIFSSLHSPQEANFMESLNTFLYNADKIHGFNSSLKSSFRVALKESACLPSAAKSNSSIQKTITDILELQLENSVSSVNDEAPLFIPKPGVEPIHAHASLFENLLRDADSLADETDFIRQCVYVWDLLVALWGKVRGLPEDGQNATTYATQIARREALSQWLIKATERHISSALPQADYLTKVFLYLSSRRIADAVKIAQQQRDFRLSLLLSQAEGNTIVRKLIAKQLHNWKQNGAYQFINSNRIILYALFAGVLVYEDVNCCKDLNWKQTLSLILWYHCNPNASVQEAVKEYDESFQGTSPYGKYAHPPHAPYKSSLVEENEEEHDMYDTCYHLLKLFCDRSHRLDLLLMPQTYTSDHLDYRLSWLLHLSLSSIGYNIPADVSSTLSNNFAAQLESLNLWHWAIFVILHHADDQWRTKQVKDVLLRCVSLDQSDDTLMKEQFLTERLLIPEKWIYEAKAVKANTLGLKSDEAWFLLKAECWSQSHTIVIKYLASDAVINEDYDYLMKYLSELALPERSCMILDWASGGQVYLDYINMCGVVQEVLSRETSAYDLEKFMPEVVSLCKRLSSIPTHTLKDRLSIAEMAKKTATILRSISILQASRTKNNRILTALASSIKNLPVPYDYAVSENRFVAHSFLEETAVEF